MPGREMLKAPRFRYNGSRRNSFGSTNRASSLHGCQLTGIFQGETNAYDDTVGDLKKRLSGSGLRSLRVLELRVQRLGRALSDPSPVITANDEELYNLQFARIDRAIEGMQEINRELRKLAAKRRLSL